MHRKPTRLVVGLVSLAVLVAAGCGDGAEDDAPAAAGGGQGGGETIRIGYVSTLSGPAAFLGEAPRKGVELAIEEINQAGGLDGRTLELFTADDEFDPAKGVAAAERLVNQDKVDVLIGAGHSGVSQAIVGVTERAQIPQLTTLSALNSLTAPVKPYVFRIWNRDANIAGALADFAVATYDRVGLLYETTAFGQGGKDALTAALAERGSEFVGVEAFELTVQDLTPQLAKLRSAGAEAIIIQGNAPQAALAARNLQQLGYDAPIIGHPGLAQSGFPQLAKGAAEGVIVIDGLDRNKPAAKEFITNFEAKFGEDPFSFYPAIGYDGVYLVAEALELVDFDVSKLRDGLERVQGFEGVVGPVGTEISFGPDDHDGYGPEALIFKEIEQGALSPFNKEGS